MSMTAPFQHAPLSLMIKANTAQGSRGNVSDYLPADLQVCVLITWLVSAIVFFLVETDTLSAHFALRKAPKPRAESPRSQREERGGGIPEFQHSYTPPRTPEPGGETGAAKALKMKEVREIFDELDVDGSETIEWVELQAAMAKTELHASVTQMIQDMPHKSPEGCTFDEFSKMVLANGTDGMDPAKHNTWNVAAASELFDSLCTGLLTLAGLSTFSPRTIGGRLVTMSWNFLCTLFVATFVANCTAHMLKEMTALIDSQEYTLDTFLSSGKVCVLGGSAYSNFLKEHKTYKYLQQIPVSGDSESSPLKKMVQALNAGRCDGIVERQIHLDFVSACASNSDNSRCLHELGAVDPTVKIVDHLRGGPSELAVMIQRELNAGGPQVAAKLSYWVASMLNDRTLSGLYQDHVKIESRTTGPSQSATTVGLQSDHNTLSDVLWVGMLIGAGLCILSVSRRRLFPKRN
jgi:hypothetical protein